MNDGPPPAGASTGEREVPTGTSSTAARTATSYRELFESAPEPYLLTDADGRIRLANDRALQLFAASRSEVEGSALADFIDTDDLDGLAQQLERARRGEGIHAWEVRLHERAEEPRVLASVEPADPGGEGLELRWVLWDAMPLELVRERLTSLLEESQGDVASMRALAEWQATLLGSAAQDMRGPLQVVSSTIESLLQDGGTVATPVARAMLERAQQQVMRLRRLLPTLLQLGRLQLDGPGPERHPFDLRRLVGEVLHDLDPVPNAVEFELEVDRVVVDPVQLARALIELLGHIAEHGPPDATVTVGATPRGVDLELRLDVTGYEMAHSVREIVFSPFLGTGRGGEEANGNDLGLSLVAVFARMHGGRAWAQETEDGGTSFRMLLSNALPDRGADVEAGGAS